MSRSKHSLTYNHFITEQNSPIAICKICNQTIICRCKGSTFDNSHMLRHLHRKHPSVLDNKIPSLSSKRVFQTSYPKSEILSFGQGLTAMPTKDKPLLPNLPQSCEIDFLEAMKNKLLQIHLEVLKLLSNLKT